jgi:hypothetical protein
MCELWQDCTIVQLGRGHRVCVPAEKQQLSLDGSNLSMSQTTLLSPITYVSAPSAAVLTVAGPPVVGLGVHPLVGRDLGTVFYYSGSTPSKVADNMPT